MTCCRLRRSDCATQRAGSLRVPPAMHAIPLAGCRVQGFLGRARCTVMGYLSTASRAVRHAHHRTGFEPVDTCGIQSP